MKMRLRKTGETVDVVSYYNCMSSERSDTDNVSYIDSKGIEHPHERGLNLWWDFEGIEKEQTLVSSSGWGQIRVQAAIAALNGLIGGNWRIEGDDIPVRVASDCVKYADALVEELKKEVKHEEDNVQ